MAINSALINTSFQSYKLGTVLGAPTFCTLSRLPAVTALTPDASSDFVPYDVVALVRPGLASSMPTLFLFIWLHCPALQAFYDLFFHVGNIVTPSFLIYLLCISVLSCLFSSSTQFSLCIFGLLALSVVPAVVRESIGGAGCRAYILD